MAGRRLTACALSLDARPHPDGIYLKALQRCAGVNVRARGESCARITKPRKVHGLSAYAGRVLIWTDIDLDGNWLDKEREDELDVSLKNSITIPENAAPNYKSFDYVFTEHNHRLYVETMNELGDTIGAKTVRSIVDRLMAAEILEDDEVVMSVTLLPDERVVEEILSLPDLRRLELKIRTPNADAANPAARRRVLSMMEANNAHVLDQTWTKPSNVQRLTPTQEVQDLARVAADTGYARGEGKSRGQPARKIATDNKPKEFSLSTDAGDNFFARLRATISNFI